MADQAGLLTFRAYTPEDVPFILDSWARSYFRGTQAYKTLSPEEFHAFHRPIRERFLGRPNTAVIVCAEAADHWHIIGWIAVEKIASGIILQYLYVKSSYKGEKLAYNLIQRAIPTSPVFYTHLTNHASEIIKQKPEFRGWIHLPHLI